MTRPAEAHPRQWERVTTLRQGELVSVRYLDGKGPTGEQSRMLAWTVISRKDLRRVQAYAGESEGICIASASLWGATVCPTKKVEQYRVSGK
ncbi:MAG: hypothetical protein NTY38_10595 [Acidobacteria bacterium]|nr:hypothetical protein [Acidobacteriota bacterium]